MSICILEHYKFGNEETIGGRRVSFHVGRLPTRFQKIMGRRYLHVVKHKMAPNNIMMVRQNVEGHGHGPLDFHASTKESSIFQCMSSKD